MVAQFCSCVGLLPVAKPGPPQILENPEVYLSPGIAGVAVRVQHEVGAFASFRMFLDLESIQGPLRYAVQLSSWLLLAASFSLASLAAWLSLLRTGNGIILAEGFYINLTAILNILVAGALFVRASYLYEDERDYFTPAAEAPAESFAGAVSELPEVQTSERGEARSLDTHTVKQRRNSYVRVSDALGLMAQKLCEGSLSQ
eukprot:gnl/MRDRNA2_/MRDRNA2_199881_c0_seq1.p1 gnl/MRDRNA2_/MRDRNA2_199881_c0~~gnl/MRDRNA2_/MRDRNA2_199881_c0_seq1.p1  ORF type:complete len:219 (+),score=30.98 gnl/MRDRNA2_/MRDRNA2_199881_c0_seq1:56-658(+)